MKKPIDITLKEFILVVVSVVFLSLFANYTGFPLVALFLFFALTGYCLVLSRKDGDSSYPFLSLGFLYLLGIAAILLFREYMTFSPYFLPIAAFSMLAALLYRDLELALLFSVGLSVTAGLIFGGNLYLTSVLLIGSIISSLFVWRARRRSRIMNAGFFQGLAQAVIVLMFYHLVDPATQWKFYFIPFANGFISAFLVAGLLPVFEYLFKVSTDISLLELADFNHPLLKRLVLEAPGTYHHSLMVGNLAEMAAESVGANALLARVGAYYHDIGKLSKPEYFSENQDRCVSKHDQLSASMSKLVIMEHVKNGVELAQKSRLNSALIDFITQHHGTSLVYYFYRRALEATEDEDTVKEEVFRYPGPKPQTKETAIVLLSDSVEAACRALDEPTAERISDIVHRIINNKFIDGQLDACNLTLRDLEKIASVFVHILGAFYHSRIDYPDDKKGNGR
jgi:putative nucleotidyltransferase with HDIG domain